MKDEAGVARRRRQSCAAARCHGRGLRIADMRIVRPHHGLVVRCMVPQHCLQRFEHVTVAQVPGVVAAPIHRAVVLLGVIRLEGQEIAPGHGSGGDQSTGQCGDRLQEAGLQVDLIDLRDFGILAAVAYPSYQAQVRRGNRTEAKAELVEATQDLEKCYTRYGRYLPTAANLCVAYDQIVAGNRRSETGRYTISFVGNPTTTAYTLQATLAANGAIDPECGALRLDQTGRRTQTGPGPTARCWSQRLFLFA